jgi:hypothetical protein
MMQTNAKPLMQKTCLFWSSRQARNIALRVYYDVQEQDGCKIFTIGCVETVG